MFRPVSFPLLRLCVAFLLTAVLSGCAMHEVRGQLTYDLRPKDQQLDVVLPPPPDKARYRYVGELHGEPNFSRQDSGASTATKVLKWVVGLMEDSTPVLLQRPQHGMVGEKDRVYVVDASRNAVMVFDPHPPADGKSDKEGGQLLVWDEIGDGIRLGSPVAVAQVWDGSIAVSDAKFGVVFHLDKNGNFIAAFGEGKLRRPTGLAFDSTRGRLFVADTAANDIKVFDATGEIINTIRTAGETPLNAPTLMSFSGDQLYVSDTFNSRIQVFDADGKHVRGFGERGLYVGNFARPKGVAVDDGVVYVVESYYGRLLAFDDKARFLMDIEGSGLKDDRFHLPSGVWTDNKGKIFVADMFNGRVVVFQFLGDKAE